MAMTAQEIAQKRALEGDVGRGYKGYTSYKSTPLPKSTHSLFEKKPSEAFDNFCSVQLDSYLTPADEARFMQVAKHAKNILLGADYADKADPIHQAACILLDVFNKRSHPEPKLVQAGKIGAPPTNTRQRQ